MSNLSEEIKTELKKYEKSEFEAEHERYIQMRKTLEKFGIYKTANYELMPIGKRHSYKLPINKFD